MPPEQYSTVVCQEAVGIGGDSIWMSAGAPQSREPGACLLILEEMARHDRSEGTVDEFHKTPTDTIPGLGWGFMASKMGISPQLLTMSNATGLLNPDKGEQINWNSIVLACHFDEVRKTD